MRDLHTGPRVRPWAIGSSIALAVVVLVTSCARERRHEVLSFFFDGVPPLDAPEEPPTPDATAALPTTNRERIDALGYRLPVQKTVTHRPVAERRCSECHQVSDRATRPAGSWVSGTAQLVLPVQQLCVACHPQEQEFRHGPASSGNCTMCHHPHASPNPHLLRLEEPESICGNCHLPDDIAVSPGHPDGTLTTSCLTCHDPHGGDRRAFLRGPAAPDAPQPPMPAFPSRTARSSETPAGDESTGGAGDR